MRRIKEDIMSVLEMYSPTIERAFKIKRDRPLTEDGSTGDRPADFEDVICLDFCNPPQWILEERTLDSGHIQPSISAPGTIGIHEETRSLLNS